MSHPPPSTRRATIASLKAEHKFLLAKEKAEAFANRPPCPYCGQTHVHSVGIRNSIRHYRCTSCKKSFCSRTGTSLYWLHLPRKFELYANNMLANGHKTLSEMCTLYGISMTTAFDWRHKVLAAINCSPEQFSGLIELRNSSFQFSRKGIKVSKSSGAAPEVSNTPVQLIITADYRNNAGIDIARIGQLKVSDIEARLAGRFDKEMVIIGPYTKTLQKYNRKKHLGMTLFSKKCNPHDLEDKKAKKLEASLRQIINAKAHGVSTKYLHHYARWALLTTKGIIESDFVKNQHDLHVNTSGWAAYTHLECKYAGFSTKFSDETYIQTSHRKWKLADRFE